MVALLAAAMAFWSSSSHDFCRIGPLLDGGDCEVCEVAVVTPVGGVGVDGAGVWGAAGEAGVGGGVAATLGVEQAVVDTELVVWQIPLLVAADGPLAVGGKPINNKIMATLNTNLQICKTFLKLYLTRLQKHFIHP